MLPQVRSVLAVCAHPDDESFGLGAALHAFSSAGAVVSVLCFTHGEASTLGTAACTGSLGERRGTELRAAAAVLGLHHAELLDHPDGGLGEVALDTLAAEVDGAAGTTGADLLLVFDAGGVTGHVDHRRATEAALAAPASAALPVLGWAVPGRVARRLDEEFGTTFVGRAEADIDFTARVDRSVQWRAIACHGSQARDNPVLRRRLELLGDEEAFRWLRRPAAASAARDRAPD